MLLMSDARRLLNFPTTAETYADQLREAQERVRVAQLTLRIEIKKLEQLLLTDYQPEGLAH